MLGRDEKTQPEFVDFPHFAQGFGFASREAISEAREFSKAHQVGFRQGCDTGVGLWPKRGEMPKNKGANRDFNGLDRVIEIWSNFEVP